MHNNAIHSLLQYAYWIAHEVACFYELAHSCVHQRYPSPLSPPRPTTSVCEYFHHGSMQRKTVNRMFDRCLTVSTKYFPIFRSSDWKSVEGSVGGGGLGRWSLREPGPGRYVRVHRCTTGCWVHSRGSIASHRYHHHRQQILNRHRFGAFTAYLMKIAYLAKTIEAN